MEKKIILDVETDGKYNIVQIAYIICDNNNKKLYEKSIYINNGKGIVDYYKKIPLNLIKNGKTPQSAIIKFINDLLKCDTIIGHNINFDLRILKNYCKFHGFTITKFFNVLCTMKSSYKCVLAKNKNGKLKSPKLCELCNFLNIEINLNDFHNAIYDVFATFECYKIMTKLKICIIAKLSDF
jgi:DNA polymerase III alpha subunit (gram-positive type)